jgi:ubiquinone/menaquinone biosynthesis C-methylase UbiE
MRSKSFPTFLEGDTYQSKMLGLMRENGVQFDGMEFLDVGAGTGAYSLPIAKVAKNVTSLDISGGMLKILSETAEKLGLKNITCIESDWVDYTPEKQYDIILCSLTPALKDEAAAEKVLNHIRRWGIQIGSPRPLKAYMLEGIFKLHDIGGRNKNSQHTEMKSLLIKRNVPFKSIPVQGEWEREYDHDGLIDNLSNVVRSHGKEPDLKLIEEYIEGYRDEKSGNYISKTFYDVELMIWEAAL